MRGLNFLRSVPLVLLAFLFSANCIAASGDRSTSVSQAERAHAPQADLLRTFQRPEPSNSRSVQSVVVAAVSCSACGAQSGRCHRACGKGPGSRTCHNRCNAQKSACKRSCSTGGGASTSAYSASWQNKQTQAYRKWPHGELVKFRSHAKDKAQITGLLYKPKGKPPFPAIVLMHGRGGAFPYQENWAYLLSKYGYVTLMVDGYCARGLRCLRLGKTKKTSAWKKMYETEFRIGDAKAGVDYLASLPIVDKGRIGGFGFSRGGSALMDAVARNPDMKLKALVALYPQDMRSITHNVSWSLPTIVSIPTIKHNDKKISDSRERNRASFPRDGFMVEVLSLPDTTLKYDQPGNEVITVVGTRFHRKYDKEATLETQKRAIALFHEHLGGRSEPVE